MISVITHIMCTVHEGFFLPLESFSVVTAIATVKSVTAFDMNMKAQVKQQYWMHDAAGTRFREGVTNGRTNG